MAGRCRAGVHRYLELMMHLLMAVSRCSNFIERWRSLSLNPPKACFIGRDHILISVIREKTALNIEQKMIACISVNTLWKSLKLYFMFTRLQISCYAEDIDVLEFVLSVSSLLPYSCRWIL